MSGFTLRQLEYFRSISRYGSISAAAENERISRSAIGAALDDLERNLKVQLFHRHKSLGMVLTPDGERLLDMAHDVLQKADQLEMAAQGQELSGDLSIGFFSSLGPTLVPWLHGYFGEHHPAVNLRVYTEPLDRLRDLLNSGEIELAVSYSLDFDPHLESAALYRTRMHAILPQEHPLAANPTVRAADLAAEPLILLDVAPSPDFVRNYFATQGLKPQLAYRYKNFEVIRSLVARGIGYSLFIQRPAVDQSYEGLGIAVRAVEPAPPQEAVYCAWLNSRRLSAIAKQAVFALRAGQLPVTGNDIYPEDD